MAAEMPEVPRVSQFIEPLTRPEAEIEARIEEATSVTPPPGPMSTLSRVAESVEAAKPPAPPAGGSSPSSLPRLPPIGGGRRESEESEVEGTRKIKRSISAKAF